MKKIHDANLVQAQAAAQASAESQFADHVQPVMTEVKEMMDTGDSISDASLEKIARWKLGL